MCEDSEGSIVYDYTKYARLLECIYSVHM